MLEPTYRFRHVSEISANFLKRVGISCLVLDVDNTLATHGYPIPAHGVREWLQTLQDAGVCAVILSNNSVKRVKPFAARLKLPFIADGKKPLTGGYARCRSLCGVEKQKMAAVGDQLFTDIWGGKRYGIKTLLVDPIEWEHAWYFKAKRVLERAVIHGWRQGKEVYEPLS